MDTTGVATGAAAAVGRARSLMREMGVRSVWRRRNPACAARMPAWPRLCAGRRGQAGFTAAMMARRASHAAGSGRRAQRHRRGYRAEGDHARSAERPTVGRCSATPANPCGIVIHSAIDACLELVRQHRPNPDEVEQVAFDVTPGALALCWRKLPDSELEAQVSLFHWLAATLVTGEASVAQAQLGCIQDARVREMQSRLTATSDSTLAIDQARAVMRMLDGTTYSPASRTASAAWSIPCPTTS